MNQPFGNGWFKAKYFAINLGFFFYTRNNLLPTTKFASIVYTSRSFNWRHTLKNLLNSKNNKLKKTFFS